jgi:cobalt-zinc-cadmium efflux system membrane fusion protein
MKYSMISFTFALIIALHACHSSSGEGEIPLSGEKVSAMEDQEFITVTRDQFNASAMKVGDPSMWMFSNTVQANGFVRAAPSGRAEVSTLIPGRIRKIYHAVGEKVNVGTLLFSLESNEFIQLQQEYAEAFNRVRLLEVEYERQKILSQQQVVAEKEFLRTESEYRGMQATMEGLKARLQMLHVDPAKVEMGNIRTYLEVPSPIGGYITGQELVLGQFINPGEMVFEVIDTETLQLYLQVFEKDLGGVASGQTVHFSTPDYPGNVYNATISFPGKSIDPVDKTVLCMARIDPAHRASFVNNLFVEARIITSQREALAVPEESLIREGENDYLYILSNERGDEMNFKITKVRIGAVSDGYAEVLDQGLEKVLLKGAFNLTTGE